MESISIIIFIYNSLCIERSSMSKLSLVRFSFVNVCVQILAKETDMLATI